MTLFLLLLSLRRAIAEWRLLAGLLFGSVIAVTLLASAPIYLRALDDLGLQSALAEVTAQDLDVSVRASNIRAEGSEYATADRTALAAVREPLGDMIPSVQRYVRSATFYLTPAGTPQRTDSARPRANFQVVGDLDEHSTLVTGRAPLPLQDVPRDARIVEGLVSEQAARQFGVEVGQLFDLEAFWLNEPLRYQARVVGIIRTDDPAEAFWSGQDYFTPQRGDWDTYAFFVREDVLFGQLAREIPGVRADASWYFIVDAGKLNGGNAEQVLSSVQQAEANVRQRLPSAEFRSRLGATLASYGERLQFARVPLFVLIFQIEVIVLYYVAMVSAMVVERQSGEIAQLKSRGAGRAQIAVIYVLQSALIAGIALALGPLLAGAGVALLGPTPPFRPLTGGDLLPVTMGANAYLLGGAGAGLAVIALFIPAYRASRLSIVQHRQQVARQVSRGRAGRHVFDLALVLTAAFLLWRTRQQSFVTIGPSGDQSTDPLLLLSPAIFTVTVALIFMRALPMALALVQRLIAPARGVSGLLALAYMARSPGHYSRLMFLLILATSLGLFAASFGATLEHSYDDRARYAVGTDIRFDFAAAAPARDVTSIAATAGRSDGVRSASPALRFTGAVPGSLSDTRVTVLAVDPERFAETAWFRDDFAGESLAGLLARLEAGSGAVGGITLDADVKRFGVWVRIPEPQSGVSVVARGRDADGQYFDYLVGVTGMAPPFFALDTGGNGLRLWDATGRAVASGDQLAGWNFIETEVLEPLDPASARGFTHPTLTAPTLPVQIVGFSFEKSRDPGAPPDASAVLDDFTTIDAAGSAVVVDGFEGTGAWEPAPARGASPNPDSFEPVTDDVHGGGFAVAYGWSNASTDLHGIRYQGGDDAVPALVDGDLLTLTNKREGDLLKIETAGYEVTVRIAGTFDLFPTFDPEEGSFMVTDLQRLRDELNRLPGASAVRGTSEIWVRTEGSEIGAASVRLPAGSRPSTVLEAAAERNRFTLDPLIETGWQGVLLIAFITIAVLSSLGMLIYSYLAAQARKLDFAVLRTMGLSAGQILRLVGLEQLLIVVIGVVAGSLVGARVGLLILPSLELTEAGGRVVPPYVMEVSWLSVSVAYGVIAAVFLASVALLVVFFSHLALHRVLRIGEG